MASVWAAGFSYLAVVRYLAGGSHAEDLGFTDQVLWNFLRGQWFRMSIYAGATWNTELDLSRLARPDSLMAFHFEPMLLGFVPLYALGGGAAALLVIQSVAVALGAIPAFRLGRYLTSSAACGLAVAAAYLLSPLGQWAVLADFHTSTLAAPLLLFSLERLVVARAPMQSLLVAAVAASAREDVAPVLICLGAAILLRTWPHGSPRALFQSWPALAAPGVSRGWPRLWKRSPTQPRGWPRLWKRSTTQPRGWPRLWMHGPTQPHGWPRLWMRGPTQPQVGLAFMALGLAWTALSLLEIRAYSGGISPFEIRYGPTLGAGLTASLSALSRPEVLRYANTLLLSGGWLALLAPLALLPALPGLALNALSTSSWMASGQAHYSGLVLPFVTLGAAVGLSRVRHHSRLLCLAALALVAGALAAYLAEGAGPLAGNYSPAAVTAHAARASLLAAELPPSAAVSASTTLVPSLSHRAHIYVFPAVLDADYVLVDLQATPAPTSAGDVYLRIQSLLSSGAWQTETAEDGLLLLRRAGAPDAASPSSDAASPTDASASAFVPPVLQAAAPSVREAAAPPAPDAAAPPAPDAAAPPAPDAATPPSPEKAAVSAHETAAAPTPDAATSSARETAAAPARE
jgi:uncharacterized membrane protein